MATHSVFGNWLSYLVPTLQNAGSALQNLETSGSSAALNTLAGQFAGKAAFADFFSGMDPVDPPVDIDAPLLTSPSPEDEDVDVAVDTNIVLTFNEDVVIDDTAIQLINAADDSVVAATIQVAGAVVTIDPAADLAEGATYNLVLGAGSIQDTAGNDFAGFAETFNFTTVDPSTGQTDVTMAQLEDLTSATAFDAGTGDFIFHLDAAETLETWITDFDAGDTLEFSNAPTGSGDFNVTNTSFNDGEASIDVASLQIGLLGLESDLFNNAESFAGIYGVNSLDFI